MQEKRSSVIQRCIKEVITDFDGELLQFSLSKKGNSAYVLVGFPELRYDVFRISYHQTYKNYFSHPTFRFQVQQQENFKIELRHYLEKSNRVSFGYQEYFVLKSIVKSKQHNTSYFVDDVYLQFSDESTGVIFYQKSGYTKKKRFVTPIEPEVNQLFRKLYADSFINTIETGDHNIQVYVTSLGMKMLHLADSHYLEDYLIDLTELNWRNLLLPTRCHELS